MRHTWRQEWWGVAGLAILVALWEVPCAEATTDPVAQKQAASEYAVKAAFLYNFARFVEWPAGTFPSPTTPIDVCVLGRDPFDTLLDEAVHGKTVNGRDIRIRRVASGDLPTGCHLVFISVSEEPSLKAILTCASAAGMLTVADSERFLARGGIIQLYVDTDLVRFQVDMKNADRAGLRISSKLLALAREATQ